MRTRAGHGRGRNAKSLISKRARYNCAHYGIAAVIDLVIDYI